MKLLQDPADRVWVASPVSLTRQPTRLGGFSTASEELCSSQSRLRFLFLFPLALFRFPQARKKQTPKPSPSSQSSQSDCSGFSIPDRKNHRTSLTGRQLPIPNLRRSPLHSSFGLFLFKLTFRGGWLAAASPGCASLVAGKSNEPTFSWGANLFGPLPVALLWQLPTFRVLLLRVCVPGIVVWSCGAEGVVPANYTSLSFGSLSESF